MKNYEFTPAQDWTHVFDKIFKIVNVEKILEFGLGLGTEFLCDNCKNVTSVELSIGNYNKEWTELVQEKLKNYNNWTLHYIDLPDDIKQANQNAIDYKYPLVELNYLNSLSEIVGEHLIGNYYDIIFIDPGIHNRGDIINFCFGKSPIIAAHDTSKSGIIIENIYGYNIVNVPENYEEVHFDGGLGTTLWVNKDYEFYNLIVENLKK